MRLGISRFVGGFFYSLGCVFESAHGSFSASSLGVEESTPFALWVFSRLLHVEVCTRITLGTSTVPLEEAARFVMWFVGVRHRAFHFVGNGVSIHFF